MTERKPSKAALLRAERDRRRREAAESFLDNLPDEIRSLRRLLMFALTNQMAQVAALQALLKDHPESVEMLERMYQRTETLVTGELQT